MAPRNVAFELTILAFSRSLYYIASSDNGWEQVKKILWGKTIPSKPPFSSMKPNDPSQARLDKVKRLGCRHQSCLWLLGWRMFSCSAVQHSPSQRMLRKRTARELLFSSSGQYSCLLQPCAHLWLMYTIRPSKCYSVYTIVKYAAKWL